MWSILDSVIMSVNENHSHTATLLDMRAGGGVGVILSQPCNDRFSISVTDAWKHVPNLICFLIEARFSKQCSGDKDGEKNNWKDDSSKKKAFAAEQLNKTELG